jgi:8-oxo-dGTP pyrophosphatase MutT (NUDIX family)
VNPETGWPAFVCLILTDDAGRYVLERRPATAKAAPGKLTCFGGKREPGERPEAALDRELTEELGLSCAAAGADCSRVVLELVGEDRSAPVAWFYLGRLPAGVEPVCRVPGHEVVRVAPASLLDADLAPWHRAALKAFGEGRPIAKIL